MSTVSVVIPCYPPHVKHLPTLLESLKKQTLQPLEVIITASEMTPEVALTLYEQLNGILRCPLALVSTPDVQHAGSNRSRGADIATGTYVAFLDADDIYHIQKLELTALVLDRTGADIVVHGFHHGGSLQQLDTMFEGDKIVVTPSDTILHATFGNPPVRDENERGRNPQTCICVAYRIHHGIPTIRREIINDVRYTGMRYGEDAMFLRDALFNYWKQVIAIPEKLMIYTAF